MLPLHVVHFELPENSSIMLDFHYPQHFWTKFIFQNFPKRGRSRRKSRTFQMM